MSIIKQLIQLEQEDNSLSVIFCTLLIIVGIALPLIFG